MYSKATKIEPLSGDLNDRYFGGDPVKHVSCGKFHSLFLTETGRVFSVGFNKYGQLGVANSLYAHAEEPIEVFTDGLNIKSIASGWHHNIMLGDDGRLYGFGARLHGQIDGASF